MAFRKIQSKLTNKQIPLSVIYKDGTFILIEITAVYEYVNNKRTNKLIGYKYTVVDTLDFDKISIKVLQETPLMTPEELAALRENGEKVLVEFVNAVDKPYIREDGNSFSLEDSFSAEDVLLVEQN